MELTGPGAVPDDAAHGAQQPLGPSTALYSHRDAASGVELFCLGRPEQNVSLWLLCRFAPGTLPGHDELEAELRVTTGFVSARTPLILRMRDLNEWERCVEVLAAGESITWLDSGRSPAVRLVPDPTAGGAIVVVFDEPDTGVSLEVPVALEPTWFEAAHERIATARSTFPAEVVESAPFVYSWAPGVSASG